MSYESPVEQFDDDTVPSVRPFYGQTPRAPRLSSTLSDGELEDDQFQFPIGRTASAYISIPLPLRRRIEECYDLLKFQVFFDGEKYAQEGITKEIVSYIRGTSGWTFLHLAAQHQHEEATEWLVKHGANRNIKGRFDGKTPYDVAVFWASNGRSPNGRVMELLELKAPPKGAAQLRRFAD